MVPKHIYDGTDIAKNPANTALIGTGPFKLAEHKPGEYYLLKRNEAYWDKEQPYLDEIVYQGAARPRRGRPTRSRRARSSSPHSPPCRWPISIGSRRCPGLKVYANGYEGADLPARGRDQPHAQGTRPTCASARRSPTPSTATSW